MDEISQSIAKNIKSGKYFEDALDWYHLQYVLPISDRSYYFLIFIVAVLAMSTVAIVWNDSYPIKRVIPYYVMSDNTMDYFSVMKPIKDYEVKTDHDANYGILRYLLMNYVKTYESYSFNNLEQQLKRIRHASSRSIYKRFEQYNSLQNPQSPRIRFGNKVIQEVRILDFAFVEGASAIPTTAMVTFEVITKSGGTAQKVERFKSKISFTFSDIQLVKEGDIPFDFTVTSYGRMS